LFKKLKITHIFILFLTNYCCFYSEFAPRLIQEFVKVRKQEEVEAMLASLLCRYPLKTYQFSVHFFIFTTEENNSFKFNCYGEFLHQKFDRKEIN